MNSSKCEVTCPLLLEEDGIFENGFVHLFWLFLMLVCCTAFPGMRRRRMKKKDAIISR